MLLLQGYLVYLLLSSSFFMRVAHVFPSSRVKMFFSVNRPLSVQSEAVVEYPISDLDYPQTAIDPDID